MLLGACSTTPEVSYLPRPDIPVRDELRQACANPNAPALSVGLVPAAEAAVANGDAQAALLALTAILPEYRDLMAFSVELAGTTLCERLRRAETLALIDAANTD